MGPLTFSLSFVESHSFTLSFGALFILIFLGLFTFFIFTIGGSSSHFISHFHLGPPFTFFRLLLFLFFFLGFFIIFSFLNVYHF
jgi:hypothetical protein